MRKNSASDKTQDPDDLNEDVEDSVIFFVTDLLPEVREVGFTGYMLILYAGISTIGMAIVLIMEAATEVSHGIILLKSLEEVKHKDRTGVITMAPFIGILIGNKAPYEGEVNHTRYKASSIETSVRFEVYKAEGIRYNRIRDALWVSGKDFDVPD